MRRTRAIVAAVVVFVALVGSGTGYLLLELGQANADLRETREALAQSRADRTAIVEAHNSLVADLTVVTGDLAEAQAERDRLRGEVHELSKKNRTLAHEKSVLTQEHDHLKGDHEQLTATHRQLGAQHEALQGIRQELQATLETTQERNATLAAELGDANAQVATLSSEKSNLETLFGNLSLDHVDLQSSYQVLDKRHSALQQAAGTVETLEAQAGALRTEIAQLEERRKPLILADERVIGFACTGSMEPKLTCLDTATWLYDFEPDDVVVGATISFESRACWSDSQDGRRTAHRVTDIRVTNGVYHYWPQGDANSGPDGCWVPHTAVNAYIIELHKNTRPENATLRNNVNAAKDAYVAARLRFGCSSDLSRICYASGSAYDALVQAYNHWECWYRNAKDSEYPGHIPYEC